MSFRTPLNLRTFASHLLSSGITPLRKDEKHYVLLSEIRYDVGYLGSSETIVIPEGFVTDLASVPRIFWTIIAPGGLHASAAVLHDWLYRSPEMRRIYSRKEADAIFYEAMLATATPRVRAWLMWKAVRVAGYMAYRSPVKAMVLTV